MDKRMTALGLTAFFLIFIPISLAQLASFSNEPAKWTPTTPLKNPRHVGVITFDCGKTPMITPIMSEPDMDIDHDFEIIVAQICTEEVENAVDWEGRQFIAVNKTVDGTNHYMRSFSAVKRKVFECGIYGDMYNETRDMCIEDVRM